MEIKELVKHRLEQLGHEQRDLAAAAEVTESYISQLLTGRKSLPAPNRSDIYEKIEAFLKLPTGELAKLADAQRREELKRKIEETATPLFQEIRELILRKCKSEKTNQLRSIFQKEPFGEIERLVTQKLLDVAKGVAKEEWKNEDWLRVVARLNQKSFQEMRVIVLEFLDTDIFNLSVQNFTYFLEPLIQSWDIDLVTFGMKVVLAAESGRERIKQFEFVERDLEPATGEEPGLREFLQDTSLSGDLTQEELAFLSRLRFKDRRPAALYYYRELQNLRDPLHFQTKGWR
ncbi:MAG: helix-turn-helix transcriptional regulator [Deltaproteobacteria bacterium]|nr:helix-turn-helix transcriptional regulator [Deltaproteobacteria bacterium]MBI2209751.1 helix-turn-helix transcriptional regulator [Deltaproteobacteria bacterium]MBI2538774.1 helix-turn-helix transcriptional regulator [Deltaproteobacteria bacterium]MBI2991135.1 helix-turn-helix transcriptional regulator [Deltaproteobacteria bacterium]